MTSSVIKSPTSFSVILTRARVLFIVLLILVITSTSSSMVLGWKSGEIDKRILAPIKHLVSSMIDTLASLDKPVKESTPSGAWKKYVNATPTQTPHRVTTQTPSKKNSVVGPQYQTGNTSYEEAVRQMNERSAAQRAAQDAWWTEQQKQFEATKQQNQQNFLNSQQQAQQNMEQFQKESQAKVEEFKKKYGF